MISQKKSFPFSSTNYRLLLIGLAIIALGFFLMSIDSEPFGFGALGLTVGPLIVVIGFIFEFWAILHKPKQVK
jgi:hypothetical protein